jgi:membrane fusion protein (multidrug efflux system)
MMTSENEKAWRGVWGRYNRVTALGASLGALLFVASGCGGSGPAADLPPEQPRNVRVLRLHPAEITEYFEISGTVKPLRGADISAEESGTVRRVTHDKGEAVRVGDTLIELDRRILAAQMEAMQANEELQSYNAEKTRTLHAAGKVSELELLGAEAQAAQARAALNTARLRWQRAAVAAPFAGIVADRYVEPGELVAPGRLLARVIDPSVLKLTGFLTEREVARVEPGIVTDVHFDGSPESVQGEVAWVGYEADPRTGKFKVEIQIDNGDSSLRPGVVARAQIPSRVHTDVIVVPRDALVTSGGSPAVYVVEGGRAHLRGIILGGDQGLMTVVLQGLTAGERMVVRGQRDLVDGSLVRITEEAERADGWRPEDPAVVRGVTRDSVATDELQITGNAAEEAPR